MDTLNPDNVVPLYKQLEEVLKQKISSGGLKPGDRLLSTGELANKYGVSVITVRNAISALIEEGLLETKQGKGTFVVVPRYGRNLNKVMSFSEVCAINGTKPGTKLIERKIIPATQKILEKLNRPNDREVIYISRLRFVNDEPMVIEANQFPIEFSYLLNEDVENCSLYELLRARSGVDIAFARREFEICRATQQEARMLHIKKGSPLLLIRAITYLRNGEPLYVGSQLINGERYRFTL
jgi:GntR family transcriptional regulator